jgi:hypothetical protein
MVVERAGQAISGDATVANQFSHEDTACTVIGDIQSSRGAVRAYLSGRDLLSELWDVRGGACNGVEGIVRRATFNQFKTSRGSTSKCDMFAFATSVEVKRHLPNGRFHVKGGVLECSSRDD